MRASLSPDAPGSSTTIPKNPQSYRPAEKGCASLREANFIGKKGITKTDPEAFNRLPAWNPIPHRSANKKSRIEGDFWHKQEAVRVDTDKGSFMMAVLGRGQLLVAQ
ncbi:MAG: hypothetical protein BroJett003_18820 [Planctomycetota bacterium]|nr:MAG: hypothetical protein BroJett003_18820 [Planctomycetota bacterium]